MILELVIGAAVGGLVVGFVANKRPQWFSKAVAAVNAIDDKVNAQVAGAIAAANTSPK